LFFSINLNAFSVTTIPASTRTPIAMAIPESDIKFDVMPMKYMNRNDVNTASGSGIVTIRIERKCARKMMWARVTRISSSMSARSSVPVARWISCVRS
jgi:hypothetical protein